MVSQRRHNLCWTPAGPPADLRLTWGGPPVSVRARITALETELSHLRQQQRAELLAAIVAVVGPGVVFSARDLWRHRAVAPALVVAFDEAGIRSVRQLGKRLRQFSESEKGAIALERVGDDWCGAVWMCLTPAGRRYL